MYKKSVTHYFAKVVIDILFVLGCVCTVAIPFVYRSVFELFGYAEDNSAMLVVVLCLSGAVCTYILYVLKQMYKSLLVGNPFTDKNVSALRRIAVSCIVIAAIFFVKMFFMFTVATVIIFFVFTVGCLFCLTLKDLFKQAINYKTENELTI